MSDAALTSIISGVFMTLGAILTVLFVGRKTAHAEEVKAEAEKRKAATDAAARDAEIEKLKDDMTKSVLARAREENARLVGRLESLESQDLAKDIQLAALRTTQADQARTINAQRDQIAGLLEQLTSRDKMIASLKIELQRQSDLIRDLQTENTDQRAQLEMIKKKNVPE